MLAVIVGASLVFSVGNLWAADTTKENTSLPNLMIKKEQETSCRRVYSVFSRSHYKEIDIKDVNFINKVIDRYIDGLDSTHTILTQAKVDEIYAAKDMFRRSLTECNLDFSLKLYEDLLKVKVQKYEYFISLLDKGFDFTLDDKIALDTSKLPFAKSEEELKNLWTLTVKKDFLNLKLAGKSDEKIKELLTKRYKSSLRNIRKSTSEDSFSTLENAFALAIDPHTSYLSPISTQEFDNSMNLEMEGIGAVLRQNEDYTEIVEIIPGSPAEKSGKLKPKDFIIGVQQHEKDDEEMLDVVGMRLLDVVPLVKGKKGSKVTLEIQRGDGANAKTFKVDLIRGKIKLEDSSAKGEVKEIDGKKVGVLTVKSFYINLGKDMKKEVLKMKKEGIEAMVVDLRQNGGGLLNEATNAVGLFIKEGPVVQVRDSLGNVGVNADKDDEIYYDGPLVVLIDKFSASASEIFAGAMQDYGRAVIVGDRSFGKGTVQRTQPLERIYDFGGDNFGSIHYTTAMFYRINGGSTQKIGVTPDIQFPVLMGYDQISEETFPNVLEWNQIASQKYDIYENLTPLIPKLKEEHAKREKDNIVFNYILERNKLDKVDYDNNFISLNYEKRQERQKLSDKIELDFTNQFLVSQGKATITNIKDTPDDYKPNDGFLDEAMRIALDIRKFDSKYNAPQK